MLNSGLWSFPISGLALRDVQRGMPDMRGEIITREEMLAIPAIEISDLGRIPSDPLVSVIMITYNHEAYIEQSDRGNFGATVRFSHRADYWRG